jgi:nicotinamidase/pyrazinamidase
VVSPKTIFWEVDAQRDFLHSDGALYVPGAEAILPSLERLVEAARQGWVLLVSSADAHNPDDPEMTQWPPHCLKGTPGAQIVPEGLATHRLVIPNRADFVLPADLSAYQQVTLGKNSLDVFENPQTERLLERLTPSGSPRFDSDAEFVVFGVVTEHCVRCAVEGLLRRGRRVAVVIDAIWPLDAAKGRGFLDAWEKRGVRLIAIDSALTLVAPQKSAVRA